MENQKKEMQELKQALLKANQDIEKLLKVKSDFVSIISHELRTPLTSIKESVSLVLDEIVGPLNEEQKKFLGITKNNIDRLVKAITDILDFSKLESGRITMHKRKLNINDVIKDVYNETKKAAEEKNLRFDLELSDGMEPVWLDPDRIAQALKNLISNAIKFNKENGEIKIHSRKVEMDGKEAVRVSVEDKGIGISKEELNNLFKDFNPLDSSMTRRHRGIGLGLAVCKGIIDLHGGDVWVESEKGAGSRVIFTLPIYRMDNEFNFLLDEAMARAIYNNMELALIIFGVKRVKDATEKVLAAIEKEIKSAVRGPEDKVTRFESGNLIAVIAGTDKAGALKILRRVKETVKTPLDFGMVVYPDEARDKEDLVKKAKKEMKIKNSSI
ncbi:MAG: ATP-binding protein [Candidatus Omnitrophica bacterium]|nr:ATP-binding protein [Candidatus Omnitrophota bacterium]